MSVTITNAPAPQGSVAAPERPTITVNTQPKGNSVLEKIKQRYGSLNNAVKAPLNKQGQPIPPQPQGNRVETPPSPLKSENQPNSTGSVEAPVASEAKKEQLNPQLAALARRERANREAQRKLQEERAAWEAEKAKFVPKERLSSDTLRTLAEAGISYDKLVELQLAQAPQDPQQQLLDKIAALEQRLASTTEQVENTLKTRDQQSYDQAKKQIQADVDLLVSSDPAYETLKATGQTKEVVALIEKVFNEEGIILDVEDAARAIEDVAFEQESKRLERLQQLSKFKAKLAPKEEATPAQPGAAQRGSTTITNNMGSTRPLSPRERAILAFEQANKARS